MGNTGKITSFVLGLGATLLASEPARAAADHVLAEIPFSRGAGGHAIVNEGHVLLCGGLPEGCAASTRVVIAPISSSNVGETIWADASTPNFVALTDLLTNGVSDPFSAFLVAAGGTGTATFEPNFFGDQVGPSGVDFSGFVIERIGYRIDSASFVSPGSDPNGDGIWTQWNIEGALFFVGGCASPPSIETLPNVVVRTRRHAKRVHLEPPAAGSECNDDVTVTGRVISSSPPRPIVDGSVVLGIGRHTIEWTADDGFGTATVTQTVTVRHRHRHHHRCHRHGHHHHHH